MAKLAPQCRKADGSRGSEGIVREGPGDRLGPSTKGINQEEHSATHTGHGNLQDGKENKKDKLQ